MTPHDFVILGGGTAGLTAAFGAASQGVRPLLVEGGRTGGDCLWTGCVPSKALLAAAERAKGVRTAGVLGVHASEVTVDFAEVMSHVKGAIAAIEPHDSVARLRAAGVDVLQGTGRFVAPDRLEVDGRRIAFRHAMVATGSSPLVPALPGLADIDHLTSDSVWELSELPRRLVVLGGGPIGAELGQAFARLGSRVTLVEMGPGLLPREEPSVRSVVAASLVADGVDVRVGARALRVEHVHGRTQLVVLSAGGEAAIVFDELLVATGRRPNVAGLGLEVAGVALDERGAVAVDRRLRTSNRRISAGGDVTMALPFTHTAAAHGATIVQNALIGLRRTVDHERIPWVTFTDPEVARVGLSVDEARRRFGERTRVRIASHAQLDRAITAGRTEGFAILVGDPRGRIVGATVVGPRAGETIGEVVAWMSGGAKLSTIVRATHAYPTWNEDLAAASLDELRAGLARLGPLKDVLLRLRRLGRASA